MTSAIGSPLSAADQMLLRGDGDPRTRSALVSIEVFDKAPDWGDFMLVYERASRVVPRLRQHVVTPLVPTTAPRWAVDPDFDLRYHVRRVRLPGSGSHRDLLDFAEQIAMTPLDPGRPLWTVTLVEGLDGGAAAQVSHMSHAVTDGVGGVEMFQQVYDTSREGRAKPMPLLPVPEDIDRTNLAVEGVREIPGRAFGLTRTALGAAVRASLRPDEAIGGTVGYAASLRRVLGASVAAPPSPLLARRGLKRRTVTLDLDQARFAEAGRILGGSLNDAYVAAVCGALRRYHEAKGVTVHVLPMAIPVSTRRVSDASGGNHWTGLSLAAPISETDPAKRIALIQRAVAAGRDERAVDMLGLASHLMSVLPDALATSLRSSVRPADVQCSNVRSYPGDTYLAGAKVVAQYALGPVPGVGLMVVLVSRMGRLFVGARYDADSISDTEAFERALTEGFDEIISAAGLAAPLAGTRSTGRAPAARLAAPRKRAMAPSPAKERTPGPAKAKAPGPAKAKTPGPAKVKAPGPAKKTGGTTRKVAE